MLNRIRVIVRRSGVVIEVLEYLRFVKFEEIDVLIDPLHLKAFERDGNDLGNTRFVNTHMSRDSEDRAWSEEDHHQYSAQ